MEKNEYKVLGIMSGTSLDGIDLALVKFKYQGFWKYEILETKTVPYPKKWQKSLAEAVFYNDFQLNNLNKEYTEYLAYVVSRFIAENNIEDLDAVCSHGHTIKHEPENGFTLQIGNLPELAKLINQTLVCDFRVQDVQLGGQGAPLVPIGDELLFPDYEFCLNLGGFANVSTKKNAKRVAFDICAVNTVLNYLAGKLQLPYDENGKIAASGKLNEILLKKLNSLEFYIQQAPKSLGIEWVNRHIFPLLSEIENIPSALKTYTVHIAIQIAGVLDQNPASKVLVTGGGAFNTYLMNEIKARTKNTIVIPSSEIINYKEALIFGFLGILKLRDEINVLKNVTGASKDHSSGKVFYPE